MELDFTSPAFWLAVGQIVLIDILLGGDNAVVIALAVRKLDPSKRRQGIVWGTIGAIALRILLIVFALSLLSVPYLKAVGALLLLWIGIGENSKVTLVAIGAFFPVYTTVSAALAHVDPKLVEAARAFGYRGVKLFTTVQLPAVLPSVVSGLRLALAQAWLFLVAAELLGASMGLGYLLTDSQNNGRTDRLLLAIVLLAVLGKLTDALIGVFERWVKAKYPSN